MNKFKILLTVLLVLLVLAAVPALAGEAEDLTDSLKIKTVDKPGKISCITDGKYTSFWESSSTKDPWIIISSDKPVYGLYLCFQKMPDSYVIQKANGDDWVTVAEGGNPRFHHAFFRLDGLKKIRIISTMDKKNVMGFNEIYAFGEGEIPDWVQQWKEPSGKTDILFLATHPDDDVLFLGSAITWYAAEQRKNIIVAYLTSSNTTRRSEALNGLWTMGVRVYPEFGPFADKYSNPPKIERAYKDMGGQEKVLDWVTEMYRKYKPEVVVTQDQEGEYGHPQHKMLVDAAMKCFDRAADEVSGPESVAQYGTWEVKKLYLHLYGLRAESTAFNWDLPLASMGGRTANEVSEEAFAKHVTQAGKGHKYGGKRVVFSVDEYGVKRYPNNVFGLYDSRVGPDETHQDFLEHIETFAETEPAAGAPEAAEEPVTAPAEEQEPEDSGETDLAETAEEWEETEVTEETEEIELTPETEPGQGDGQAAEAQTERQGEFAVVTPPDWADVKLNEQGFLDEGEYIFADEEEGHYIYVSSTLRVVIERTYETFEKEQKKDPDQELYVFTANIWCNTEAGELPRTVNSNPENPRKDPRFIKDIAADQKIVFATSTDYYTYRAGRAKEDKSCHVGVEIRNGAVLYDDPQIKEVKMPNYETLALYYDGHAESYPSKDKTAESYLNDGAAEVFTFGPCLVRNGELTEYIATANRSNNPRLAIGVAEPGHYVVVLCEGRVGKSDKLKRSTGVMMKNLAQIMKEQGCTVAVNMDGGQTAVMAFMGKQINRVVKTDPKGRASVEALAFGFSEQVGTFELEGIKFKK